MLQITSAGLQYEGRGNQVQNRQIFDRNVLHFILHVTKYKTF